MCYQSHDGKPISIISIYVTEESPSVSFLSTPRSKASLYPRHNGKPISIYATAGSPSLSSLSTSQREAHMYHLYLRHGRKPLSIISIYTMVGNPSLSSLSTSRWEAHLYHLYLRHGGKPILYGRAELLKVADLRSRGAWPCCGNDAISFFFVSIMFIINSLSIGILYVFT